MKNRRKIEQVVEMQKIRSDSIQMICEKEKLKPAARVTGVLIRGPSATTASPILSFLPLNAPEHELNRVMGTIKRSRPVSRSEKRPCA